MLPTMPDDINGPYTEVPAQQGEFTVHLGDNKLPFEEAVKYVSDKPIEVGQPFPPLARLRLVTATLEASGWLTEGSKS